MPVFDAMINLLRSNSVVQSIEQITTKFKPGWSEDYLSSLRNSIFQLQDTQFCIIEDRIGVQPIWVHPLDKQQKYKLPYLEFVLGLPCLIENKMPAPLHSYPQTTQ